MEIKRYSSKYKATRPYAAAIGNFDGMHLGHQKLLAKLTADGKSLGLPTMLCTFYPLPWEKLSSLDKGAVNPLHNLTAKLTQVKKSGVDTVLLIHFSEEFRRMKPDTFIKNFLVSQLNTSHLITGADFRFGYKRSGSGEELKRAQSAGLFSYVPLGEYPDNGDKISSSVIRKLLLEGEIEIANKMLGYDYYLLGKVGKGSGKGAELGFATANLNLKQFVPPLKGVFAGKAYWGDNINMAEEDMVEGKPAIANLGYRPTLNKHGKFIAEVHILEDFNANIYGKFLKLVPMKRLRDEKKFSDVKELIHHIGLDKEEAIKFFVSL